MKFYSADDIEKLAAQGQKELIVDETIALTDLARDVARELGITLTNGPHPVVAASKPLASSGESRGSGAQLPAKPKGCQHGPLTATPAPAPAATGSTPIVDRLVGMVRQIGKRSGNNA